MWPTNAEKSLPSVRRSMVDEYHQALLREVVIVGEHLCEAVHPHRLHRDTVGQAVSLVQSSLIELEACQEGSPCLLDHGDVGIGHDVTDDAGADPSHLCAQSSQESEA